MPNTFDSLFNPKSVAIFGASSDATRISGRPVRYLREGGYQGRIYPINPGRSEVQGLPAFAGIEAIGSPVDAAIIALAPDAAVEAVRASAAHGVRQVVMFSSGFAEMGEAGLARQHEIRQIARASGMRILGPNCLGVYSAHSGAFLTFSGVFDDVRGTAGRFGLVSQSGGYAGEVLKYAKRRGIEFGTWVTTGNEADIEFGEMLAAQVENPQVDAIVGYIEGIRDRDSFLSALEMARQARKPIILLKVGRTAEGAEAAASHTAALAGADELYDAVFREYGVHRARTTEDMLDVAYALRRGIFPQTRRLAIVTNSGGLGIQAADFASDESMEVPPTPPAVAAEITALLPNAAPRNPVDTTGQVANEPAKFGRITEAMLETGLYDSAYVVIGLIGGLPFLIQPLTDAFRKVAERHGEKLIVVTVTAPPEIIAGYEAAGLLAYDDPARAIRAISAMTGFREAWDRAAPVPAATLQPAMPLLPRNSSLNEVDAKAALAAAGIRSPEEFVSAGPAEAAAHVAGTSARYAIKVVSPDILHKTEVGGVALGVPAEGVGAAVAQMQATVASRAPDARVTGYLVTPMLTGGVECFVGVHDDPLFGPVVMFGLGGVTVELYKDVTTRLAPLTRAGAEAMIRDIRGFPLLNGFRGRPVADIGALADALVAVSELAMANRDRVTTIEINPLLVMPEGQGAYALDAVIVTK